MPVEGAVAQQAVQPLGTGLLVLVEGKRAGEGAHGEPAVAAARAAPELEHRDREQSQTEGQPAPEFGGCGFEQVQHALDRRRLHRLERPAGTTLTPLLESTLLPTPALGSGSRLSYHLYEWYG